MPEVNEYFPEIFALEAHELYALREEILAPAKGSGDLASIATDDLAKLAAVQRALQRKAAPAGRHSRSKGKTKKESKLEDLL